MPTALVLAAEEGNFERVFDLLKAGANPADQNQDGQNCLHLAACWGEPGVVQQLLDAGVDQSVGDANGCTPLHLAACWDRAGVVDILLREAGGDLDIQEARDSYGWTALSWAATKGNVDTIDMLVLHGLKPDVSDSEGRTPLYWAASRGEWGAVVVLLKAGANPGLATNQGETVLHWAAGLGEAPITQYLCEALQDDINPVDAEGRTPLHLATMQQHLAVIKVLLEHRARTDVRMTTGQGLTPIHIAAELGSLKLIEVFAHYGCDMNALARNQASAVDLASFKAQEEVVASLVKHGGRPVKDLDTPLQSLAAWAQARGYTMVTRALGDTKGKSRASAIPFVDDEDGNGEIPGLHQDRVSMLQQQRAAGDQAGSSSHARPSEEFMAHASIMTPRTMSQQAAVGQSNDVSLRTFTTQQSSHPTRYYQVYEADRSQAKLVKLASIAVYGHTVIHELRKVLCEELGIVSTFVLRCGDESGHVEVGRTLDDRKVFDVFRKPVASHAIIAQAPLPQQVG